METHKSYLKFLISLVLFGSNGIVASFISLKSFDIVLLRTFIGSIFIISVCVNWVQKGYRVTCKRVNWVQIIFTFLIIHDSPTKSSLFT